MPGEHDRDLATLLEKAVVEEDVSVVQYLLRQGAPTKPSLLDTILENDFGKEGAEKFTALLKHDNDSATPVFSKKIRREALIYAVWNGDEVHEDFISCLLDKEIGDVNPNFPVNHNYKRYPHEIDADETTLLHLIHESWKTTALLLEHGADPNRKNSDGDTPLHAYVTWGQSHQVQLMIKYGANPNVSDRNGYYPLHKACRKGRLSHAEELSGADPDLIDKDGYTALHYACYRKNRMKLIRWLLEDLGANPTPMTKTLPLETAFEKGNYLPKPLINCKRRLKLLRSTDYFCTVLTFSLFRSGIGSVAAQR